MKPFVKMAALAAVTASLLPAAASQAATTYTPPASIARDCSAPVTASLNSWLASIPSGTADSPIRISLAGGCYLLDDITTSSALDVDGVQVIDKTGWIIDGDTATLRFGTTVPTKTVGTQQRSINRSELTIRNGANVTVTDLTLEGKRAKTTYDPNLEYDHNLTVLGGHDVAVTDITASEAAGDNVAIKAYGTNIPTSVTVQRASLTHASRHNLSIIAGKNVRLDSNVMVASGYWTIDAEISAASWPITGLNVTNNLAYGSRYGFLALSSRTDSTVGGVSGVSVTGNNYLAPSSTNYEFVNINSSARSNAPTNNVSITKNNFVVNQYGISAKYVSGLTVSNNTGRTTGTGSAADCSNVLALVASGPGVSGLSVDGSWTSDKARATSLTCTKP